MPGLPKSCFEKGAQPDSRVTVMTLQAPKEHPPSGTDKPFVTEIGVIRHYVCRPARAPAVDTSGV